MYRKKDEEWIRHLDFEVIDIVILILSFLLVQYIYTGGSLGITEERSVRVYLVLFATDIIVIFFSHPYRDIVQRGYLLEFMAIVKHFVLVDCLTIITFFMVPSLYDFPHQTMLSHYVVAVGLGWIMHTFNKTLIRKKFESGHASRLVLVSDLTHAKATYDELLHKMYPAFIVTAVILRDVLNEEDSPVDPSWFGPNVKILYGYKNNSEFIRQDVVDQIYLDGYENTQVWHDVIGQLLEMGIVVHIGLTGLENDYPNEFINYFGRRIVLTTCINYADNWRLLIKRAMDIIGSIVGLIITIPIAMVVVPMILLADPGPVIFKQKRVGKNGRIFDFYKFRSMYMDAEERKAELIKNNKMSGHMFKIDNDPRIIGSEKGPGKGIGNFIRRTSIDELPQFWNVLRGDMCLVGTRPPTLDEYRAYEMHHKVRLSMRPGLTGMWQVSGRSDITDFEEVVRLDTEYIQNWNLGLDIKILLKTILIVFQRKGSR